MTERTPYYSEQEGCYIVPLPQGRFAKIDREDVATASQRSWHISPKGYAQCWIDNRRVLLHRLILSPPKGVQVDHTNGDRLDNRRSNIRLCTHKQNMQNQKMHKTNTSGFIGVFRATKSTYHAQLRIDGKPRHLGSFLCPIEAAIFRDVAALEIRGEFARLNFPHLRNTFST